MEMTVEEIMKEVMMDQPYYGDSGGMTISGGEPFIQHEFLLELLKAAKERHIHCGIETNCSLEFEVMKAAIPYIDVWMIDLKAFDDGIHRKYTGVTNKGVKHNLKELDKYDVTIVLRTPVVPGINDNPAELEKIVEFAAGLEHLDYYEILPYHPLGLSKQIEKCGIHTAIQDA